MKMFKLAGLGVLFVLTLFIPLCKAADPVSAFPWKKGEVFTYRSTIEGEENFAERGEIKKIKQKKERSEYSIEIEVTTDQGTLKSTFDLDDKGNFMGSSGTMQSKMEMSTFVRMTSTFKNNEITTTSQVMMEGKQVHREGYKFKGVSDDAWIFMDGIITFALRLSLEPLEPGYDKIHSFFILNPFTQERRSGKLRLQVTGDDIYDFGDEKVPVYILDLTAPKQPFTMKPSDKDQVTQMKLWVMKSNKKLVKFVSTDLEKDVRLDP